MNLILCAKTSHVQCTRHQGLNLKSHSIINYYLLQHQYSNDILNTHHNVKYNQCNTVLWNIIYCTRNEMLFSILSS